MKNWIWLLVIPLVGFLGYLVLTNNSSGEKTATIKGVGIEATFGSKVGTDGKPQPGNASTSDWTCYHYGKSLDTVKIWWGHETKDAAWACNNWISKCGNEGGCQVQKVSQ